MVDLKHKVIYNNSNKLCCKRSRKSTHYLTYLVGECVFRIFPTGKNLRRDVNYEHRHIGKIPGLY